MYTEKICYIVYLRRLYITAYIKIKNQLHAVSRKQQGKQYRRILEALRVDS